MNSVRQNKGKGMVKQIVMGMVFVLALVGCNLSSNASATVVPTPDLPQIEILDPPNNVQIVEGTDFDIDILAQDATSGIIKVELYVDGELIQESNPPTNIVEPQYRVIVNWLAQGTGKHVIEAVAYRQDGTRSDAALITVEVIAAP
jgi:hypothetical protein